MAENETTGEKIGKLASKALKKPADISKKEIQKLAGSLLTQRPDHEPPAKTVKKR